MGGGGGAISTVTAPEAVAAAVHGGAISTVANTIHWGAISTVAAAEAACTATPIAETVADAVRSILRRRPGARGGVLPLRGAQAAAALGGLPPKHFGTGEICTAHSAHAALHCPLGAGS